MTELLLVDTTPTVGEFTRVCIVDDRSGLVQDHYNVTATMAIQDNCRTLKVYISSVGVNHG